MCPPPRPGAMRSAGDLRHSWQARVEDRSCRDCCHLGLLLWAAGPVGLARMATTSILAGCMDRRILDSVRGNRDTGLVDRSRPQVDGA